jgi:hypothetical protein
MAMWRRGAHLGRLVVVCGLLAALFGAVAPAAGAAQEATPVPAPSGALANLLHLAPDPATSENGDLIQLASYADVAAQTAVVGEPLPTSVDDPNFMPWADANRALLLPSNLLQYALRADWRSLLGFDLWDIDQSLEVGAPPIVYTLLRGRFNAVDIRAAWSAQGYKMLDVDGIDVASLHEGPEFDISTELGRYTFARYNNAAILPDGTLVYSPTLDGMRTLIAIAQGKAPSLGDRVDVAALVGAIEKPLASALLMTGAALQWAPMLGLDVIGTPEADALRTQVAEVAKMPPIATALLGITPGGPIQHPLDETPTPRPDLPAAQFEIAILLPNAAAAQTAAQVIEERLQTMVSLYSLRPLTDYFASWDSRVLSDAPVVVLELTFAPETSPNLWVQMIARRDLPFLAW